jgi:hypothetical protein
LALRLQSKTKRKIVPSAAGELRLLMQVSSLFQASGPGAMLLMIDLALNATGRTIFETPQEQDHAHSQ